MPRKLTVGSLFAGIGGFDLGLERAGFEIKFQVEIDPFCRKVLEKHWPAVRRYEDVREVHYTPRRPPIHSLFRCDGCLEPVEVLCGGFPCQDISYAGTGAGIDGARSGLWSEFGRLIGELRPRFVVVENVAALLDRGMGRVLGDLAALGYDAEWDCIPASAVGAPHERERVWIIAYPTGHRLEGDVREAASQTVLDVSPEALASWNPPSGVFGDWPKLLAETGFHGMADGIPNRTHRLRAIGNSVVPQIAEFIGRRILEAEAERLSA